MSDVLRKVPELKLSQYLSGTDTEKRQFIDQLFMGIKDYGFIILKDHPISSTLLSKAYQLSEQLFSLSETEKLSYYSEKLGGQRGYTPFGKEHAKDAEVMDLKEFWHVGRELTANSRYKDQYPENLWPENITDFKETFQSIYNALEEVGKTILSALTTPLEVPEDFFTQRIDEGNSILRLLHYPPIPEGTDPRCVRAAAHEDINLITILVSASASGLELKDRDGKWLPVESEPNSLIVDAGDMLARITNEVIPATTHRVVNPADSNTNRYSMPFFIHPNPDVMLSCLDSCRGDGAKYQDITSQDFLMERLREIGLA